MTTQYDSLRAFKNARDPNKDKKFSKVSEMRETSKCMLDGCDNTLSHYQGPGSLKLCRGHQIVQREYGGFARTDRPWTFWKKDHCEECGHKPSRDNKKIVKLDEPYKSTLGRMMLHVDHISVGRHDKYTNSNGVNHPDNLVTLCMECHMLKTYAKGDHVSDFHTSDAVFKSKKD